jgi:hypothetical protein
MKVNINISNMTSRESAIADGAQTGFPRQMEKYPLLIGEMPVIIICRKCARELFPGKLCSRIMWHFFKEDLLWRRWNGTVLFRWA